MSGAVLGLASVRRALATRRALVLVLGAALALALAAAGAALAARLGLFGVLRWGPAALWAAALAGAVVVGRVAWRLVASDGVAALRDTAALVERELSLRRGTLIGVVDVAAGAPAGTSPGLAASAAARMERTLPPAAAPAWVPATARALTRRTRALGAGLAVAVVAAGLSFWLAGDAAASLVSPFRAIRAAARARVTIAVSARSVRKGGEVTVTVRSGGAPRPTLHVRATGESWRLIALAADPAGVVNHRLRDIRAPLFVYASAGDAASDTVRVAVVEPPFVAAFEVTARYPAYLGRPEEAIVTDAGPLSLPVGTVLVMRGSASAPLREATLTTGRDSIKLRADGAAFAGDLVVRGSALWRLALFDRQGEALPEPLPSLDVRAIPDSAPIVTVPIPGADTTAPLDLKPPVVVDARDDHGLGWVEIVSWRVSRLGTVGDTVVDSLAGVGGADRVVLSQLLDLTNRNLLPGDTLRFFVRAGDRAPIPHVGRSREYALRLRSLAELREAVRAGANRLASEAAAIAADQGQLSRQTEDLAAPRNRSADRPQGRPDPRENSGGTRPEAAPGTVPFEQAEESRRIADRQQELAQRAESMRQELQRLARAAEEAGLNDPAWQQRLRELEELMRQAITPELALRLEELRRALERLDPRAVQDALRRLSQEQQRVREELERSAELFERAALEGSMQTYAQNAENLRRAEQQWTERAPSRRDSTAAAADQERIRAETDSLRRGLEQLAERMRWRGDTASARGVQSSDSQVSRAEQAMTQAAQAMEQGERSEAARRGGEASESLRDVPDQLRRRQQQMSAGWRAEVLRQLANAMNETVALAREEQRMARQLRRGEGAADALGRQSAVEQGVDQVIRQLQQAAGRNALVEPRLGSSLGLAREQVGQSRQALEGPSPSAGDAAERAEAAAQSLSAAALRMMRNRDRVAGSQSGSGLAEALQRMAELAGQQGQLSDQLGGLLPMFGSGEDLIMQQLRSLAARQRAMANELERLGESGVPGRPEQLADEARQLADRLDQGRLDRATLERQQRLFRRMLDAGRTLRNEDEPEDPERKSETARERAARAPGAGAPGSAALRYPVPSWEALRALSPAERAMVLDYFRRLNAQPR